MRYKIIKMKVQIHNKKLKKFKKLKNKNLKSYRKY